MSNYLVMGEVLMESTGQSASYEFVMEDYDYPPTANEVVDYIVNSGELQIIPQTWEEVDEDGVGI